MQHATTAPILICSASNDHSTERYMLLSPPQHH